MGVPALLLAVWLGWVPQGPANAPSRLTLRNGTVYLLKEPPRISGTRVVFTTLDGRQFILDQSEIAAIGASPKRTVTPKPYDIEDSRALGAIAREQRNRKGKRAEVAPRRPAAQSKAPRSRATRTPGPSA